MFLQIVSVHVQRLADNVNVSGIYLRRHAVFDHAVSFFPHKGLTLP
jgi:hypothetical protein